MPTVTPCSIAPGQTSTVRIDGYANVSHVEFDGLDTVLVSADQNILNLAVTVPPHASVGWRKLTISVPAETVTEDYGVFVEADPTDRKEFLLHMYDVAWTNIGSHFLLAWQAVTALIATIALLALAEKEIISFDVATAIIVLGSGWVVLHALDAWEWFHRNLVLLTNIERQFLKPTDQTEVLHFFSHHRRPEKIVGQVWIQIVFVVGLSLLLVAFHFWTRIVPGMTRDATFDLPRSLPYLFLFLMTGVACWKHTRVIKANRDAVKLSPGLKMR